MMSNVQKIAVLGAAGAIGRVTVPELLARGHAVRVVGRNADRLRAAFPDERVEIVAADVAGADDARRAVEGCDGVLYAVGLPYPEFVRHPALVRTALDAARAAGVRAFVHISNVYPFGRPRTAEVAESHPREPHTRKGAYRLAQEQLVLDAHDDAGLRTLALRLPDFYGPTAELSFVRQVFEAALNGKAADVVGPIDTLHEFVFVPDVAPVIADLFARSDAFGRAYHLAGERATTRAFATMVYEAANRPLRLRVATGLLVRAMGIVNPFMRELHEMLYLWKTPVLLDETLLRSVIGAPRRTPLRDGIAATVAALRATAPVA